MRLTPLAAARWAASLTACLLATAAPAADGLFAPRLWVNDKAVSNYEVEQRMLFLTVVNTPGDIEDIALTTLTEDRLRLQAAEALDIVLTDAQITEGMAEFAGRANLSPDEFIAALAERGVDPETFRDFVAAGLTWREVIRARFGGRVQITNNDIDRALSLAATRGDARVLLSELIIPAPAGEEADARALAQELAASLQGAGDFAEAAREFSASPSAEQGGQIDWLPLTNLPPAISELILTMEPGTVSAPVPIPNAIALFLLRAIEDTGRPAQQAISIDYAQVFLPDDEGGEATAARFRASADSCDDLYGLARDLPADQLVRQTQAAGEVPRDVALELARLDAGETSFGRLPGRARVLLMLCSRTVVPAEGDPPTRDQIRTRLINQRLTLLADGFLAELKANAIIREP